MKQIGNAEITADMIAIEAAAKTQQPQVVPKLPLFQTADASMARIFPHAIGKILV